MQYIPSLATRRRFFRTLKIMWAGLAMLFMNIGIATLIAVQSTVQQSPDTNFFVLLGLLVLAYVIAAAAACATQHEEQIRYIGRLLFRKAHVGTIFIWLFVRGFDLFMRPWNDLSDSIRHHSPMYQAHGEKAERLYRRPF